MHRWEGLSLRIEPRAVKSGKQRNCERILLQRRDSNPQKGAGGGVVVSGAAPRGGLARHCPPKACQKPDLGRYYGAF